MNRFLCWFLGHDWSQWDCEVQNIPGVVEGGDINCKRHCQRGSCGAKEE